jgi:Putative peptidoglycan binding domain
MGYLYFPALFHQTRTLSSPSRLRRWVTIDVVRSVDGRSRQYPRDVRRPSTAKPFRSIIGCSRFDGALAMKKISLCLKLAAASTMLSCVCIADSNGNIVSAAQPASQIAQGVDAAKAPAANIEQIQVWLVWAGYYDGPLDGSVGPGTTSAIKQFQRDIGAEQSGSLSADQSLALSQRAATRINAAGFSTITDFSTGIRVGMPLALVAPKDHRRGSSSYRSTDGTVEVELRSFQSVQDLKTLHDQFKDALSGTVISYSALRSSWFVFASESDSKRFYLRFNSNPNAVAGFVVAYDKTLPGPETSLISATISIMSLAIQPFANPPDSKQLPNISQSAITTLAALVQSPTASTASDQPANDAAPPPVVTPRPAQVTPRVTPPAGRATSNESDALAAANRRIAELESELATGRNQVDTNAPKMQSRENGQPNSQQLFLDIAVAATVGLFFISLFLAARLKTVSGGSRAFPPHQALASRDVSPTSSAPATSEDGQQNVSIASPQLAAGIGPAFARIPSSIFNMAATLAIGACIVLAVAIISRVFGL